MDLSTQLGGSSNGELILGCLLVVSNILLGSLHQCLSFSFVFNSSLFSKLFQTCLDFLVSFFFLFETFRLWWNFLLSLHNATIYNYYNKIFEQKILSQIQIMNSFRIQLVKQQPPVPSTNPPKPLPKLNVDIQSIVCLNYPIQTLLQVLNAHFDEQPCAANLVVKALKVISISLKDKELRTGVERILSENLHKRNHIYVLFVYWSSFAVNLMLILSKIDAKLVQNLLACAFSVYLFTECKFNSQISNMMTRVLPQLSPQTSMRVSQYIRNQFMSMNYPIQFFITNLSHFRTSNQKISQFLNQIAASIIKSKQSEQNLKQYLKQYFRDERLRAKIDNFFMTFPNLLIYFINNLCAVLEEPAILQIWSKCGEYKMETSIRSAIKQWVSKKENYWRIFTANFNSLKSAESDRFQRLLELGFELDEDSLVSKFMMKQNLLNYFHGIDFDVTQQTRILQKIVSNKQSYKKMHSIGDAFSETIKCFSNKQKDSNINLILINKIHAPENWARTDIADVRKCSNPILIPFIKRLTNTFNRIQKQSQEKGKKVQLAFHGIVIVTSDKKQMLVTYTQLVNSLKQNKLPLHGLQQQYHPFNNQIKKQEPKKQIQGIVIQAKIVRVMKKSKTKLSFNQIYDQVIKQINVPEEICKVSLEKVISKGLVESESNDLYTYCP